ncbi:MULTISPECIES: rhodanese-like domain-containing protein [Pseudomonadaceae]|uniref:Rhodanese-like domain-containing protein n=1 Tax=Ectopseudomonas mendocina TaxID=300 RepID=A0ABZ2RPK1_ECTME|nr:rhodanese-like domain-containing protein [Pseudomonas aeruginosa]
MKTAHDLVEEARQHIDEVSPEAAETLMREADAVIDVREPDEYQSGHIPGAINIPRGLLEFRLSNSPELAARDLNVILYCKTSGRAALAARSLADMGYLQVRSIEGGYDAWHEAGKPIARPTLPPFE